MRLLPTTSLRYRDDVETRPQAQCRVEQPRALDEASPDMLVVVIYKRGDLAVARAKIVRRGTI